MHSLPQQLPCLVLRCPAVTACVALAPARLDCCLSAWRPCTSLLSLTPWRCWLRALAWVASELGCWVFGGYQPSPPSTPYLFWPCKLKRKKKIRRTPSLLIWAMPLLLGVPLGAGRSTRGCPAPRVCLPGGSCMRPCHVVGPPLCSIPLGPLISASVCAGPLRALQPASHRWRRCCICFWSAPWGRQPCSGSKACGLGWLPLLPLPLSCPTCGWPMIMPPGSHPGSSWAYGPCCASPCSRGSGLPAVLV